MPTLMIGDGTGHTKPWFNSSQQCQMANHLVNTATGTYIVLLIGIDGMVV